MDKTAIRRHLRALRQQLSAEQRREASDALVQRLLEAPQIRQAGVIALYAPTAGEVDPCGLMERLPGKIWVFPRVESVPGRLMHFYPVADACELREGAYGILEPTTTGHPWDDRIDVVITPLVAFDARGFRLGMGGGFYDRFFARHPEAWRVGVGHAFQQVDEVPTQVWDMPLHHAVTDAGEVVLSPPTPRPA